MIGGVRTYPVRTLVPIYFAAGLLLLLAGYADVGGGGSYVGEGAWVAAAAAVPLAYVAAGYLCGNWSALWLVAVALAAWIAADIFFLGFTDACDSNTGVDDECKPPSLIVLIFFPWLYGALAGLIGTGILLRRRPAAGAILLGAMGMLGVASLVDRIDHDDGGGVRYVDTTTAQPFIPGTRVQQTAVAQAVRESIGLGASVPVECLPAIETGLGDWGCKVESPRVSPAYPALVAVADDGSYEGSFTDNRGATRSFAGCCVTVTPG
jgi:hypothetical protein